MRENGYSIEDNTYNAKCIKCGKTYKSRGKAPVGECPECLSKEERFCNRCGQPIDYWEYESNVEGYCEECWEEECNTEPDDEDWTECNPLDDEEDWEDEE